MSSAIGDVLAAAFLIATPASVVNEDEPHQLRGDRKKVRPILPHHAALLDEPEVGLVDQGRWLNGVTRAFPGQMPAGQLP